MIRCRIDIVAPDSVVGRAAQRSSLRRSHGQDSQEYLGGLFGVLGVDTKSCHAIVHKGAYLLLVFHTEERPVDVPAWSYRLLSRNRVQMVERRRLPSQHFSTRALEKLFRNFSQVKFFLTQESLREVLVRK